MELEVEFEFEVELDVEEVAPEGKISFEARANTSDTVDIRSEIVCLRYAVLCLHIPLFWAGTLGINLRALSDSRQSTHHGVTSLPKRVLRLNPI